MGRPSRRVGGIRTPAGEGDSLGWEVLFGAEVGHNQACLIGRAIVAGKCNFGSCRTRRGPLLRPSQSGALERDLATAVYCNRRQVTSTGAVTAAEVDGFAVGGRRKLRRSTTGTSGG